MSTQAKSYMQKPGRPKKLPGTKAICVTLTPKQFKLVEKVAKEREVSNPEALRRMAFIGLPV
jgi:hypothetical protein